jgi:protein KRI1
MHAVEEKYGKNNVKFDGVDGNEEDDYESSSDEDEDDDGEFATADVDAEIMDTLNAIRSKDPRVYDSSVKFFKEFEAHTSNGSAPKEKAMTLKDYHRKNLLDSANGNHDDEEDDQPRTYAQEQAALKDDVVRAFHNVADDGASDEEGDEEDDTFLKAKSRPTPQADGAKALPDPSTADKDPETFLSNFFAARAWVPTTDSRFAHLESDDDEADQRAEDFETAYNLRFEDPSTSNTTLKTHARDVIAAVSVRRDETMNPRKRAREKAKLEKEALKAEREVERARLRKLKIEEMEGKLEKIRYAAGERDVDITDWAGVLQEDWDDAQFDEEMRKRFGDEYYEKVDDDGMPNRDEDSEDDGEERRTKKSKKAVPKKPTWDDDIDIKDLVSDFEDEDQAISLSEDEDELPVGDDDDDDASSAKKPRKSKTASKRDRRLIESLAQQSISSSILPSTSQSSSGPRFAYRETSPTSFGLTALDILAADDAQLNEWAGLKKLATFRDAGKKEKDKRRLGKKGRLREWRKETFGRTEGPSVGDWYVEGAEAPVVVEAKKDDDGVDVKEGKRKKRRRGKKKGEVEV